jgi:hypothetical protein
VSLIVLRRVNDCAALALDTSVDLRAFIDGIGRRERHWHGCTRRWHMTDGATASLKDWAARHGHTVISGDDR